MLKQFIRAAMIGLFSLSLCGSALAATNIGTVQAVRDLDLSTRNVTVVFDPEANDISRFMADKTPQTEVVEIDMSHFTKGELMSALHGPANIICALHINDERPTGLQPGQYRLNLPQSKADWQTTGQPYLDASALIVHFTHFRPANYVTELFDHMISRRPGYGETPPGHAGNGPELAQPMSEFGSRPMLMGLIEVTQKTGGARGGRATITVNSTAVTVANDGLCTLPEAVTSANTNAVSGAAVGECAAGSGADVVDLTGVSGTITLTTGLTVSSSITFNGPGAANLTVSGNNLVRFFNCTTGGVTINVNDLTITGGRSGFGSNFGGAIRVSASLDTLAISRCNITGSAAISNGAGGGLFFSSNGGSLTMTNCAVSGNATTGNGFAGGIYFSPSPGSLTMTDCTMSVNTAAGLGGGGLYTNGNGATTASLTGCTISGNTSANQGGGINNQACAMTLTHCTVSGNTASGGGLGGGILNATFVVGQPAITNLNHCTIATNIGAEVSGVENAAVGAGRAVTVNLTHTIIAQNSVGPQITNYGGGGTETITNNGYNLIGDMPSFAAGAGDLFSINPLLNALANNGGLTQTHSLHAYSPAIENGNNAGAPANDQRGAGFTRILDGDNTAGATIDIGAVEFPAASTLDRLGVTLDASGNLIINDVGAATDDNVRIQSDTGGSRFIITELGGLLIQTDIAGATGDGTSTVNVPFAAVTGTRVDVNLLYGNDILDVNYALGNFSKTLNYAGGYQSSGDQMSLTGGGTFATVTHTFVNANDGSVAVTSNQIITYTGLEPITDNLSATNRVFDFTGATETITLSDDATTNDNISFIDSDLGESVTFVNPTASLTVQTFNGTGADNLNVQGLDAQFNDNLTLDGDADDTINFQTNNTALNGGNLLGDAQVINFAAGIGVTTTVAGTVSLTAGNNIVMNNPSSITTVNGNISLTANAAGTGIGNFVGINMNNADIITTGSGSISLTGFGGDDAASASHHGVLIQNTATVQSTGSGTITLIGTSGVGNNLSRGVFILGAGTLVTSITGNIQITGDNSTTLTGTGGGNIGISIDTGAVVSSTGTGVNAAQINLIGVGGSGSFSNFGIHINGANALVTAIDGDITVNGTGNGGGASFFNPGVLMDLGGAITSTGTGANAADITVGGQGGTGTGGVHSGVAFNSRIITIDGDIIITGTGGTQGNTNRGIVLEVSGQTASTGTGNVTLDGRGGNGSDSHGIYVDTTGLVGAASGAGTLTMIGIVTGTGREIVIVEAIDTNGPHIYNGSVSYENTAAKAMSGTSFDFNEDVTFGANGVTFDAPANVFGNWTNGGGYAHNGQIVIFDGTNAVIPQTIGGTAITTFFHLRMNNNGVGALFGNRQIISSALTLDDGLINPNGYDLIFPTPTVTINNAGNASFVLADHELNATSEIIVGSFTAGMTQIFPVGINSRTSYMPVTLTIAALEDSVRVFVLDEAFSNGTMAGTLLSTGVVRGTWDVGVNDGTLGAALMTMQVQWNSGDQAALFSGNYCRLAHFISGAWDNFYAGAASGGGPYTFTRPNITGAVSPFSMFGMGGIVPTMGEWALIIMTLAFLSLGTVALRRHAPAKVNA